jgi:hypothetical protein
VIYVDIFLPHKPQFDTTVTLTAFRPPRENFAAVLLPFQDEQFAAQLFFPVMFHAVYMIFLF